MGNFSRDGGGFRGGRDNRGGSSSRGGFGGGDRPMFDATCADCGKACKVPFNPTGEKPVYCSDCFDKHRQTDPSRSSSENNGFRRESRSFDRPPRNEYRNESSAAAGMSDQQFKEFATMLDKKLDIVINLLTLISGKKTLRVPKTGTEGTTHLEITDEEDAKEVV